ncbi:hypothetical protein AVEN_15407-1 [Araneus ventricosus]|uniref:RNase H type-1 domain-containing protein n=1 Tax=Araneus ventricosus TaxID=182803 RepID=A0A4Y2CRW2_ARAVE|nr:hypothetical protein AVEN_15407-1 [Araneus ventricosus]
MWSDDKDGTGIGTPCLNFHATPVGGRLTLDGFSVHQAYTWWISDGTELQFWNPLVPKLLPQAVRFNIIHLKKTYNLCSNFNGLIASNWRVSPSLLKFWYLTAVEKALLYGAAVWGGALTEAQISKLHSIQRTFSLKLSRVYKTTPTNSLNILLGIPALLLVTKSLFIRFNIWKLDKFRGQNDPISLDFYRDINSISSDRKIIICADFTDYDYEVYNDESRIGDNVGFLVCIFERNLLLPIFCYKVNSFNSVFQAELAAVNFSVGWALERNVKIKVFSDSKSSIEAIRSPKVKSNFVLSVKDNRYNAKDLVSHVWVEAHAGNPGNELSDHFAKIASSCGADMSIPAPYSYVKRVCKEFLINEWNSYWQNSTTGKCTKEIRPSANRDLLISNKYVIYLLTNHGPFPAYLCRFKILNYPDCLCGEHGGVDHYLTSCMYTKDYHLLLPTGAARTR